MNTEITEFSVPAPARVSASLLLLLVVAVVFVLRHAVPGWVVMWLMAGAIFLGCKWLTLSNAAKRPGVRQSPAALEPSIALRKVLAYLFAWPGMDADAFFARSPDFQSIRQIANRRYLPASLAPSIKTVVGATIFLLSAHGAFSAVPLARGWLAMFGLVLFLHFGIFDLFAVAWKRAGINAQPIMRAPLRATSLAEFWSKRWNTAFNTLAHQFVFRPVAWRYGSINATLAVFLLSGLVHETVISLPARGGYGLPTAYFALQSAGILLERSAFGRRLGLGHGFRGWLFTVLWAGGPAYWLFHPIFVRNVILPMLDFIGAT